MASGDNYRIESVEQLRRLMGEPNPITRKKLLTELDEAAIDFIKHSPFLVLGTSDADRNHDASPKGDNPGFVLVESPSTIVIPERKGNKLLFSLQNILINPNVGMVFMVPGTGETLRVNGTAELTTDPTLLERLATSGAPALLGIRVTVRECFFHCAKAFIRSQLWRPETWDRRVSISWGKYLVPKIGGDDAMARQFDKAIEQDYNSVDPARKNNSH